MASSSSSSSLASNPFPFSHSLPLLPLSQTLKPFRKTSKLLYKTHGNPTTAVKAQTAGFAGSFYEGGLGSVDEPDSPFKSVTMTAVEEFETPPCPPGFRQYETMAVLRPDMSENGRLALTRIAFVFNPQRSIDLLVAVGGMYVEVFNRGVIPLAYSIRRKRKKTKLGSLTHAWIAFIFSSLTSPKPESMGVHEMTLNTDNHVIRSSSFKICQKEEIINKLPVVLFDEELRTKDSQCCVCLGDFEIKEELLQIPSCKHVFHINCIQHWLYSNSTCPLCRCDVMFPTTKLCTNPPQSSGPVLLPQSSGGGNSHQPQNITPELQQQQDVGAGSTEQLVIPMEESSSSEATQSRDTSRLPDQSISMENGRDFSNGEYVVLHIERHIT
ncbi:hypothetical protein DKX38_004680 [Salix brachista]|uniref:RING-type E3 ubiquitin transferase n=1 Tax=Salix brachista TaxID=2182728 RepID=A0A5N5NE26_9ROSI|nr:hypothetical protein DKX38_004680 [Salix brachista]